MSCISIFEYIWQVYLNVSFSVYLHLTVHATEIHIHILFSCLRAIYSSETKRNTTTLPEDNSKIVLTLLAKSLCRSTLQEDLLIILFFFLSVCSSPENETIFFLYRNLILVRKKFSSIALFNGANLARRREGKTCV